MFKYLTFNVEPNIAPDELDQVPAHGIDPEAVIARNVAGEVVSRFKDDYWDFRAYGGDGFYLDSWLSASRKRTENMDSLARTITDEIKHILWLIQNTPNLSTQQRGRSYARQAIQALKGVARLAYTLKLTLAEAEHSAQFLVGLRASIASMDTGFARPDHIGSVLSSLASIQAVDDLHYPVPRLVPEDELGNVQALLKKLAKAQVDTKEQTPLIPTGILSRLITNGLEILEKLEPVLPKLEAFIQATYADPHLWCEGKADWLHNTKRVQAIYPESVFPSWKDLNEPIVGNQETLERFGLREFFEARGIRDFKKLIEFITRHQTLCAVMIHAFSGMRSSEVQVMPFNPVVNPTVKGLGDLPVFVSHTKKMERANYSAPLTWATSKEGLYAARIAQQLSRLHWFRNYPAQEALPEDLPLFIPALCRRPDAQGHYAVPASNTPWRSGGWRWVTKTLGLIIEEADLDELRVFDAFRAWDDDPKFAVGAHWPLTSHQFRRSVAVYASRSGMVSLPSLKTQYKHLSAVMTAYYGEGSSYAQSFLMDEEGKPIDDASVLAEFRAQKHFNASVQFHERIIRSHENLAGPKGTEIQLAKDKNSLPKIMSSRKETEKALKQGRLSFKETPVGGCMLKGVCPHFGIDVVLPCTSGCKDAILTPSKLENYVDNLRFELDGISPNSRPYQAIQAEIKHIESTFLSAEEDA